MAVPTYVSTRSGQGLTIGGVLSHAAMWELTSNFPGANLTTSGTPDNLYAKVGGDHSWTAEGPKGQLVATAGVNATVVFGTAGSTLADTYVESVTLVNDAAGNDAQRVRVSGKGGTLS